ncbi:MAG TPA: LytTR family DNA-binding domain-containing protein [Chitinophagales bacterium]|nr:LytTR family DNA-binding domain-containing protein [Chitinophagales bacterium]
MLRFIIVEDEDRSADVLLRIMSQHFPAMMFEGRAGNVQDAVALIKEKKTDLVFLDVELPDGTGMDVLRRFEQRTFKVIFTTAYDHYALPAIKFSAIDFLLKPLSIEETKSAVDKVLHQSQIERLDQLVKSQESGKLKRLALPTLEGFAFIEVADLIFLAAEGNYTVLHTNDGKKHIVSKSLKEYEELLASHGFFRIHHSHVIQLDKIVRYVKGSGGYVVMKDGTSLDVSARRKEEFLKKLTSL